MASSDQASPLLQPTTNSSPSPKTKKSFFPSFLSLTIYIAILFALVVLFSTIDNGGVDSVPTVDTVPVSRGVKDGVSEKSTAGHLGSSVFQWTNAMLSWQRTAFHFQPPKNWMNDPNGPLYYKGWYHLFYQYNPASAVWGNITWGHAVSRDLIHWYYLPLAMVPDRWYDINGVWTGSATHLPDGQIIMLYTGSTNKSVQVQNLAFPANQSDPLLLNWVKSDSNPILVPPAGIGLKDFRDPTTAWFVPHDDMWRVAIGSKDKKHAGIVLVYKTKDFVNYTLNSGVMHSIEGIGMMECVDFFPVSTESDNGLDTSVLGQDVKHVLKASLDDNKHDYYAIGSYNAVKDTWTPDDPQIDVGIGLRYDYGKYYASKTFYDTAKERRILWGWTGETDSESTDLLKGWASVQTVPRTVVYDKETGTNLLQWPVKEVVTLRSNSSMNFTNITISPGSVVPLDISSATQLDIIAEFEVDELALENINEADVAYNCSTSGGSAGRGLIGPFGLLVLADKDLSERTAVYFYIAKDTNGRLNTYFCNDELRSSLADDLVKTVYGSTVPVLNGEKLSVRTMVDHSIIESFAQGGRTCITSRVYPTKAIYSGAKVFLFNNATNINVTAKSVTIWEMKSAFIRPYEEI